jgi:hypothetical protein
MLMTLGLLIGFVSGVIATSTVVAMIMISLEPKKRIN